MKVACFALLTDFGLNDWYVAAMKGVLLLRAPGIPIIDVTHEVPAGDVEAGAFVLESCWRDFPEGTVFLGVVDPGVGTSRLGLVGEVAGRGLVGPDNGLFGSLLAADCRRRVFQLRPERVAPEGEVSATFHGRDLFAPAAGLVATGMRPGDFGPLVTDPVLLPERSWMTEADRFAGKVVWIDRFGNALTTLPDSLEAEGGGHVELPERGVRLPLRRTFGEVPVGSALAYWGSAGRLEVAIRDGSATERLGLRRGSQVDLLRG